MNPEMLSNHQNLKDTQEWWGDLTLLKWLILPAVIAALGLVIYGVTLGAVAIVCGGNSERIEEVMTQNLYYISKLGFASIGVLFGTGHYKSALD